MRGLLNCGIFDRLRVRAIVALICAAMTIPSAGQTFTTLVQFDGNPDGEGPEYGALVQGRDGNLYGTTAGGTTNSGAGTVFRMTPDGTLTTIYYFCLSDCADGSTPVAGLVLGTDGNFYGTTALGGDLYCGYPYGCGTVFKITPAGVLTTLHTFIGQLDGAGPHGGLVQGLNGNFYGTTGSEGGDGTVFKITPSGTLTTVHFLSYPSDGLWPIAGPSLGTDGNFYGTTQGGGTSPNCNDGCGTVYKVTPAGKLTTLHSFDSTDGTQLVGGVAEGADGNFYGTTVAGGTSAVCAGLYNGGCGTVFQLTPAGKLTTLYNLCSVSNCLDGLSPYGTIMQATDGNLYGTALEGGTLGYGTLFQVTTGGAFSVLHNFDRDNGGYPYAGLMQATNGILYGTTFYGGSAGSCNYGCGSIYSLDMGLSPFVQAVTYSGKVGATIEFLGQGFSKSSTVSFNGTSAIPSVKGGTYLTVKVPSGATTGVVTITTSGGTLTSNKIFRVVPQITTFSPISGPVGTSVVITGQTFTGATTVTFGGIKATSFTVDSYTQITATVPTGAKTGKIAISTPSGTATSSSKFTVTP
jgi:uncharacterized repeat protein (TIGR03803 family)